MSLSVLQRFNTLTISGHKVSWTEFTFKEEQRPKNKEVRSISEVVWRLCGCCGGPFLVLVTSAREVSSCPLVIAGKDGKELKSFRLANVSVSKHYALATLILFFLLYFTWKNFGIDYNSCIDVMELLQL